MSKPTAAQPQTYYSPCDNFSIALEEPDVVFIKNREVVQNMKRTTAAFVKIAPGAGSQYTTDDPGFIKILDAKCEMEEYRRFLSKKAFPTKERPAMKHGTEEDMG